MRARTKTITTIYSISLKLLLVSEMVRAQNTQQASTDYMAKTMAHYNGILPKCRKPYLYLAKIYTLCQLRKHTLPESLLCNIILYIQTDRHYNLLSVSYCVIWIFHLKLRRQRSFVRSLAREFI